MLLYMPIKLFYELKKYEDTSSADPLRPWGGQRPPRPPLIGAHGVPVYNFPIQHFATIFGKEMFHHSYGNKLHKVQESAASIVGDKHQPGEG